MVEFSAKIADEITNYSEKDLPDAESADTKPAAPEQNQPSAPVNIAGLKDSESNSDVKDAIMAHISKEGRIYYTDLRKIMNQRDLDDRIQVGGLSLTRCLAFYYPDECDLHKGMPFYCTILEVKTDHDKVAELVFKAYDILNGEMPDSGYNCEFCRWTDETSQLS